MDDLEVVPTDTLNKMLEMQIRIEQLETALQRANATTENVTAADIRRISWSTNGNISITRNGFPLLALHNAGEMRFDEFATALTSNNGSSIVITITTGGSFVLEVAKQATYNVDPFTGATIP